MSTELELSGRYARLQRDREDGVRAISRGGALLISAPVSVLVATAITGLLGTYTPLFICGIYCVVATAAAVAMMAVGALQQRSAQRRLDQLDHERLPAARLLR
ncbi:MAG TPA: hypothetical protein VFQ65_22300 [Kofleriaceae bacterium]|nr:hypothetical protein [Kofleriaceae bacterium]